MATRFEMLLHGENEMSLRAAGEEAIAEIERLEQQLSLYRPSSEIAALNARAARGPVRVSPQVFALLQHAKQLSHETNGAFDITIGPLVRCWGFMGGNGRWPADEELARARSIIGMNLVHLDGENFTVQFEREGVTLDLGAIGKGYALDQAVEILREGGVSSALLHGGTSTAYALGHPPDAEYWKVAVENPPASISTASLSIPPVLLKDEAMSISAIWGRAFQKDGKIFGHVIDPRTGNPATSAILAAIILPSATETDALSTALLILGSEGHGQLAQLRARTRTILVSHAQGQIRIDTRSS
jgi:thiamine biosynthesis lipoprotein